LFDRHNVDYGNLFNILSNRRMREKGRKWDGRSRIATEEYKNNYDEIFKKEKTNETTEDKKQDTENNGQDN